MATTQNEHNGDGSDRRFSFTFPYIKEDDVKVSLRTSTADVTTIASTEYTFPSATEIQFNALSGAATTFQETTGAPKTGVTIRIFRDTDLETQRVTFFPGSSIRAQDLNDNTLQNLYASQERQSRAVDSTGGALTGNLTLNAADIVFEGDTADDFETTLTVVDPTADRTITLPNVTGTVITTGDTATITDALLAGSSVTTAKIAADAVDGTKIADNAIDSEHYVDGSIDRVHLAADIVDGTKIADNSIDSEHYVDGSIDTVHLASLFGTGIPSSNLRTPVISVNNKGQVTSIQSSSIAESDIASDAVTTTKIANDAVTAAKIAANAITEDDGQLADNSVVTAKIKDLNVTTGKLAADAVTGAKIADDAVDSEHIAAGAIDLEHMSDDSVDSDQYVDGSIDTEHIGDQQITSGKLATNAVTTAKIQADAITNAKIANNAVQKENINGLNAEISDLNQIDGKTLVTDATWTSDTQFPSAANIDARITARIDPIDGFVAIADEDSFPTTTPPEGTAVSISNAGGMVIGASASTTDASRAGGSDTVTIQNIPANMQSQTIQDGIGMIVIATSTAHTYDFHRVIATNADVIALSDDINDFNNRYRVGSTNPTTDNDEGDLFYNTGNDKMLVWDGSEWDEVQSIGEYFIIPDSDFPTWNGTLNDISITSNAPANAEQIILSINGVIQEPNSGTARPNDGFSLNGSTIQLAAAPAAGSEAWGVIIGSTVNIGTPSAGTVGTTQLADGAVTNVKVATNAAIAGSKIDPDFGSQDIVTTGSVGINTSSPSVDLDIGTNDNTPRALGVRYSSVPVFLSNSYDGSRGISTLSNNFYNTSDGSASTSAFVNTGYTAASIELSTTTGASDIRFATASSANTVPTERLRINSSGRVGIGTTSPLTGAQLTVASGCLAVTGQNTEHSANSLRIGEEGSGVAQLRAYGPNTSTRGSFEFTLSTSDGLNPLRTVIDSSGNVGIGVTSNLAGSGDLSLQNNKAVRWAHATNGTQYADIYGDTSSNLVFRNGSSSTERMRIDSSGRIGIGSGSQDLSAFNANGSQDLVIYSKGTSGLNAHAGITLLGQSTTASQCSISFADGASGAQRYAGAIDYFHSNDSMSFRTSGNAVMRIDSSGRLLVGTSSYYSTGATDSKFQVVGTGATDPSISVSRFRNDGGGATINLFKSRGSIGTFTVVNNNDTLGEISFFGADGSAAIKAAAILASVDGTPGASDMPGRLVFSTTADGASSPTERMRIGQNGEFNHFTSNSFNVRTALTSGTAAALYLRNNASSTASGTTVFVVAADGDVENTNNSYGALSDLKLKENVVDASSQWDDLKALQVRKYNFKEETGFSTHTQIGLIAQEVELVSPGLVSESPDRDAEGNDLGTTTKSVNYSVLYMKAVKALQEAMERIETLETKVATLEGGE